MLRMTMVTAIPIPTAPAANKPMQSLQLSRLLQLSSPSLPIGGYSYSQGLEAAIEHRLVTDEDSARGWMESQLALQAKCEAPIWLLLFDAWHSGDRPAASHWNQWFLATRESAELRRETEQMGWSLARLAAELGWAGPSSQESLPGLDEAVSLPAAHAFAAQTLGIARQDGLTAYLCTWLENQVMAAIKAIPLGQVAGQRILDALRPGVAAACRQALERAAAQPPRLCTLAPQLAILSARHETQYSRLFRS